MKNTYEFKPDDFIYYVTGRKKRKKEFMRSITLFTTTSEDEGAVKIFDKYFKDDFTELRRRIAGCLETITIIGQAEEREKIPLGYWEQFNLFSEAINMVMICYKSIRMGHWLAGLVLLRQVIEIVAVSLSIWLDTKKNLKLFHEGQLKATRCVSTSKKILPALARIWGDLSNYHVHPSKRLLGTSFVGQNPTTGWGRIIIGGYLHPDQSEKIETAVIYVLLVAYYLHAAIELIFWDLIEEPEFWKPIAKTNGRNYGTWGPKQKNEEYLRTVVERMGKISDPFYGYEDRIPEDSMKKYYKLLRSGRIRDTYDIEGLRKVIKQDPKFFFVIYILANAYRFDDQKRRAIALYKHLIRKTDEIYDSYHFLGNIYAEMGEDLKAIEAYEEHIGLYPDDHMTLNRLGLIYDRNGDYNNALKSYRKAQSIEKDYYNAIYNEANTLKHKNEYDAAIAKYEEAISIKGDPWAYHNMALTYWEKEKVDDAYRSYRKAVVTDPGFFPSWFNLGAACRIKGNPKKAYLCYIKCIHLNAGSLETAITLANLSIELLKLEDAKMWADGIQHIKPGCEISKQILDQIEILSKDLSSP